MAMTSSISSFFIVSILFITSRAGIFNSLIFSIRIDSGFQTRAFGSTTSNTASTSETLLVTISFMCFPSLVTGL